MGDLKCSNTSGTYCNLSSQYDLIQKHLPFFKVLLADVVTNQAVIDKWHEDDHLATYYLFNTCDEQQKRTLLTCASAHSIWTSLTSRYQIQQNTAERRHSLLQTFLAYTYNPNHCVRAHIEAVKLLAQQLSDAGGNVGDEGKCTGIIASLPLSYDSFLTSWEST